MREAKMTDTQECIAIVDNVLALNKMHRKDELVEFEGYFRSQEFVSNALGLRQAIRELDPVQILASARAHLLKRAFFDKGDARAHFVLTYCIAAISNERRKPSETCQVLMTSDAADQWGTVCSKPAVGDSELCEKHLSENGL